jgi:hypothetical protein
VAARLRKNSVDNDFLRKSCVSKENMSLLGYAYLHAHLKLTGFEPVTHARLGAVNWGQIPILLLVQGAFRLLVCFWGLVCLGADN